MRAGKAVTVEGISQWLLTWVRAEGELSPREAAWGVLDHFGEFVYQSPKRRAGPVLAPEVVAAFRRLAGAEVVWERRHRLWVLAAAMGR